LQKKSRFLGAAALVAALALTAAGCSSGDSKSPQGGGAGAAITVRGCTPQNALLPANTNEVCGGNVLDAISAKLVHYNADDASPELDIAESFTPNADMTEFTVKLKQGYKFQDGTDVKAKNFVDAWNWGAYAPNGQKNSSFLSLFDGYDALQCEGTKMADGKAKACVAPDKLKDADKEESPSADKMTGLKVVDDYTFTIKVPEPMSNLEIRLGYTAFSPLPDAFFTASDPETWAKSFIGAGPYQLKEYNDREMVLQKFADYSGKNVGAVDQVTFKIYNDTGAAYTDVVGNTLDLTDSIPTDRLQGDLWKTELGEGRWGVKDTGVYQQMTFSPTDENFQGDNGLKLRKAFSMALDRDEVTKVVFNGARVPATGWVSPVVDGYKPNVCTSCTFDPQGAKKLYDEAGGYKGTLELSVNGDGGHLDWAEAVVNQWRNNLGVDAVVAQTPDFATLRTKINNREIKGIFRSGWQMDYPSIENFLSPIYMTDASSNDSGYSNPEFDKLLTQAAAEKDANKMNELYQQAEAMLDKAMPTIPQWYQQSQYGTSNRIKSIKMTPFSTFDFSSVVMA
jgi:oligopeptide transport system substrate-binding protein